MDHCWCTHWLTVMWQSRLMGRLVLYVYCTKGRVVSSIPTDFIFLFSSVRAENILNGLKSVLLGATVKYCSTIGEGRGLEIAFKNFQSQTIHYQYMFCWFYSTYPLAYVL